MAPRIAREQDAVAAGREALNALLAKKEFDESAFTAGDHAALDGAWSWFGRVVEAAMGSGPDGMADDLLAPARPWGFDLASIRVPVLVVHGAADRIVPAQHGEWLASHIPGARTIVVPEAGHIDVLMRGPELVPALRGVSRHLTLASTPRPVSERTQRRLEGRPCVHAPDRRGTTAHAD